MWTECGRRYATMDDMDFLSRVLVAASLCDKKTEVCQEPARPRDVVVPRPPLEKVSYTTDTAESEI